MCICCVHILFLSNLGGCFEIILSFSRHFPAFCGHFVFPVEIFLYFGFSFVDICGDFTIFWNNLLSELIPCIFPVTLCFCGCYFFIKLFFLETFSHFLVTLQLICVSLLQLCAFYRCFMLFCCFIYQIHSRLCLVDSVLGKNNLCWSYCS